MLETAARSGTRGLAGLGRALFLIETGECQVVTCEGPQGSARRCRRGRLVWALVWAARSV